MKTALLIIDVQNIMFEYVDCVHDANQVLANIGKLLTKARDESVPVIYIQHAEKKGSLSIGSSDWRIQEDIRPLDSEIVIPKYSWDSFLNTSLEEELQKQKIERLVIVGMQTEYCVDTTVRRAYSMGYTENILVRDGHSTFDTPELTGSQIIGHHNAIWDDRFATLKSTDEINYSHHSQDIDSFKVHR